MKTISLVCVLALAACGGTGDTNLDGGGDDSGNGGDSTPADTGTNGDTGATDGGNNNDGGNPESGIDAGNFNVANVSGLVLWLEADVKSSITLTTPDAGPQKVSQWNDQTSHHNDAKGLTSAISQGRNPSVKSGGIHGVDAVHFDQGTLNSGNMLSITDNSDASLQWGTGDFYVAVVGDFDNDPTKGQNLGVGNFFSKATQNTGASGVFLYGNIPGSNVNPTVGMTFSTAVSATNVVTTTNAYNNLTAHLFAIRRQSGKLDLFVDGASVASSTSGGIDVSNIGTQVRIGADGDANFVRLDGDIGEIIAVKGVLAGTDESGIEAHLKAKWSTP